jgi:hypothetical protein
MKIEFIKWDSGDNLQCLIDGKKYVFAFIDWYGGSSIYGICFPDDDFFTFLSRSKKAAKLYAKIADSIAQIIKENPIPQTV